MSRQHPWPHAMGIKILISITVSEIWGHCQNLLDDPRILYLDLWLKFIIWASAWDFQQCGMCDQQSLRSACAYAQSVQSLCLTLVYSTSVKLLTEHHLELFKLQRRLPRQVWVYSCQNATLFEITWHGSFIIFTGLAEVVEKTEEKYILPSEWWVLSKKPPGSLRYRTLSKVMYHLLELMLPGEGFIIHIICKLLEPKKEQ